MRAPRQGYYELGGGNRTRFWNNQYFDENFHTFYFEVVPLAPLKIGGFFRGGDQLDLLASRLGSIVDAEPFVQLDVGRGVNINLNYTWQALDRDGGTAYDAKVTDTRVSWQFDPRQRLRLSVQASDITRDPTLYAVPVIQHAVYGAKRVHAIDGMVEDVCTASLFIRVLPPRCCGSYRCRRRRRCSATR